MPLEDKKLKEIANPSTIAGRVAKRHRKEFDTGRPSSDDGATIAERVAQRRRKERQAITDKQEEREEWKKYYERVKNREPMPLLQEAVASLHQEQTQKQTYALDLGCGPGVDTLYLLQKGWHVTAVDNNEDALKLLREVAGQSSKLDVIQSNFDEISFKGPYDIVNAGYSLPFNHPKTFTKMFTQMIGSIREGGLFVGQLFGDQDEWHIDPNMTFHTKNAVEKLFSDMGMTLAYEEVQNNGPYGDGTRSKDWHVFHITATKKITQTLPEAEQ